MYLKFFRLDWFLNATLKLLHVIFREIENPVHVSYRDLSFLFGPTLRKNTILPSSAKRTVLCSASRSTLHTAPLAADLCGIPTSFEIRHPQVSIIGLKNVYLVGRESFVYTRPHEILVIDNSKNEIPIRKIRRPIARLARRIVGPILSFGGRYTDNHYHFLLEFLPLLLLSRKYLIEGTRLIIIVTKGQSLWQAEYLCKLGEDPSCILEDSGGTIYCDSLWLATNLPLTERCLPYEPHIYREVVDRLRRGLTLKKRRRKVFISREDAKRRRLLNELEVIGVILKYIPTLEVVNLSIMSLDEQIVLFSEAVFVIGAAGQAFRNVLFCDSAQCIELVPGTYGKNNIYCDWIQTTSLLASVHLNQYYPLFSNLKYSFDNADWMFPPKKLDEFLSEISGSIKEN